MEKARSRQNEGMSQRGGWSARVIAPSARRSVALLHWASCSKSSLCIYLRMLPRLRRINALVSMTRSKQCSVGCKAPTLVRCLSV